VHFQLHQDLTNEPWVYIVVSNATTGLFACSASRTSSEIWRNSLLAAIDSREPYEKYLLEWPQILNSRFLIEAMYCAFIAFRDVESRHLSCVEV